MESKKIGYLFLPFFVSFAIFAGGISYADIGVPTAPTKAAPTIAPVDMEALKAELKEELRAELVDEIKREMRGEMPREVAPAPEVPQSAIDSAVSKALGETGILSGLFKGATIGGFIDTMFSYNFANRGLASSENNGEINGLNFIGENEDNSFTLENFALFLDKTTTDEHHIGWQMHTYWGEKAKRITFLGEGAGRQDSEGGTDVVSGTDDTARNDLFTIATANITWDVPIAGRRVPVTMGKMYTWIGYELVENIGNPNYSHGMIYNNVIPFTHMGISVNVSEFLPGDKLGLTLYYVNGWDSFIDNNKSKTGGFYLTYQPNDDFFISLGGILGNEGWGKKAGNSVDPNFVSRNNNGLTQLYDVVVTYSLPQVEKLSLGANFDWGITEDFTPHDVNGNSIVDANESLTDAKWWSAAAYVMYDFTDAQQGAFRYEYFDDTDNAKTFDATFWDITYTQNMKIYENLLLRPEARYIQRSGSEATLPKVGATGSPTDTEFIFTVGAEYVF